MKKYSLSPLDKYTHGPNEAILQEAIIAFMIKQRMSTSEKIICGDKGYHFRTGIPYGFMGELTIYNKTDDRKEWLSILEDRYTKVVTDTDSFVGKFLRRIETYIDGKENINILEYIVPECYPPRFMKDR